MARPIIRLRSWTLVLLPLFLLFYGCASADYRTASSTSKLEHWVPQDPWNNQKAGVCCYVYERPAASPEKTIARAEPEAQPIMTRGQIEPAADRSKELTEAKALLAAKDGENRALAKELESARTELASRALMEKENAELRQQLDSTKTALADKARLESDKARLDAEKAELARQLDAARTEAARLKTAQSDLSLRLKQDDDKANLERQLREAQTALNAKSIQESRAADLEKQLQAARTELALKASVEKEKVELARKLDDARTALAQKTARERELDRAVKSMEGALKKEIGEGSGSVQRGDNSFTVDLADRILYDSGSAQIKPEGLKILKRIAESLKEGKHELRVEGHTDDVPIRKSPPPRYHSNWELSVERAVGVVEYLEKNAGIAPNHLSAAGYSYTRPAVPNENDEARAKNRRVEIIVTPAEVTSAEVRQ
jgi:chemotaxis protein MotB